MGVENGVTLSDVRILMDQAAEVSSANLSRSNLLELRRLTRSKAAS